MQLPAGLSCLLNFTTWLALLTGWKACTHLEGISLCCEVSLLVLEATMVGEKTAWHPPLTFSVPNELEKSSGWYFLFLHKLYLVGFRYHCGLFFTPTYTWFCDAWLALWMSGSYTLLKILKETWDQFEVPVNPSWVLMCFSSPSPILHHPAYK